MTSSYKGSFYNTATWAVLSFLLLLDAVLTIWGLWFPELWFKVFHNSPYVDPQGLLRRSAAAWFAFFILQAVALVKWKSSPWLLLLVAGCRLGDVLTDVTCLAFAETTTLTAKVLFPLAGVGNLAAGVFLIFQYLRLTRLTRHIAQS